MPAVTNNLLIFIEGIVGCRADAFAVGAAKIASVRRAITHAVRANFFASLIHAHISLLCSLHFRAAGGLSLLLFLDAFLMFPLVALVMNYQTEFFCAPLQVFQLVADDALRLALGVAARFAYRFGVVHFFGTSLPSPVFGER
ncbi:MAG TPA: hypothetical protein VF666_16190 [Pyrinomonadaceae bacterium]|jgi:hypothetical protein